MKNKMMKLGTVLSICVLYSCSHFNKTIKSNEVVLSNSEIGPYYGEPHEYGGWYCPDNLKGFPPVDIASWKNVPVIVGRMPTKEETQTEASLIFVDSVKHPNAKVLDLKMPKLASFYNQSSKRHEHIIVIQAFKINNDSIVGFRYLNGGNGSARIGQVKFLSEVQIELIPKARFVSQTIKIKASKDAIWNVLTKTADAKELQSIFDKNNKLELGWRKTTNVNFKYSGSGALTASYADLLYGCYYIQNDFANQQYNEKFFLAEDEKTKQTELKIVCGPFGIDFETQKSILNDWAQKVKELSENK